MLRKKNIGLNDRNSAKTSVKEVCDLIIVARNDKNGNPLHEDVRLSPENCPDFQEIINSIYESAVGETDYTDTAA
jgi:hypothetical protein